MEPVKLRVIGSEIGLGTAAGVTGAAPPIGGVESTGAVAAPTAGHWYARGTVNRDRISVDAIDVATLAHGNGLEDGAGLGGEDERGGDCGDGALVPAGVFGNVRGVGDGIGKVDGAGVGSGRTSGNGIGAGMYTSSGSGRW